MGKRTKVINYNTACRMLTAINCVYCILHS